MDVRVGLWRKLSAEELMLLTVVLEKTLESPLDCKEIQPVHPKGNQSWVFTGRTDVETETPILWSPDAKNWLIWKGPDAGKDWGQEEKGMTEDEMAGWHHRLNEHEFGWTPGVGDGQEGLACCNSWGHKESDATEWLNWTDGCFCAVKDRIERLWQGLTYLFLISTIPPLNIFILVLGTEHPIKASLPTLILYLEKMGCQMTSWNTSPIRSQSETITRIHGQREWNMADWVSKNVIQSLFWPGNW